MHIVRPTLLAAAWVICTVQSTAQARQPWQMQDSGAAAGLRGIDSVDGTVAWASGTGGTVLKTIDGGAHWQPCAIPDAAADGATLDFRGVQAWDSDTAIVMASGPGEKSRLYKTTDGCRTWTLLFKNPNAPDGFFDSFWLNAIYGQGILLGDPVRGQFTVFETEDGGQTWKRDRSKELSLHGNSLAAFAASNSSIARSDQRYFRGFVTGGKGGAVLYMRWYPPNFWKSRIHPRRSGLVDPPWSTSTIPLAGGSDASGAFSLGYRYTGNSCHDCGFGAYWQFVAVGGDYTKPAESAGTAAWSGAGGLHWTASAKPPHGYRSSVEWSDSLNAWITAGTNGSDISRDDGQTWQPLDDGNWNALSLPFVVGPNGRIARLNPSALPAEKVSDSPFVTLPAGT